MGYEAIERDKIRAELADIQQALRDPNSPKSYLLDEITIADLVKLSSVAEVDMVLKFDDRAPQIPDALPDWI